MPENIAIFENKLEMPVGMVPLNIDLALANIVRQFNNELQQQIDGTLPQRHTYNLGYPSEALLYGGVANLPIDLLNWFKSGGKLTAWADEKKVLDFVSTQPIMQDRKDAIIKAVADFIEKTGKGKKNRATR